jgi:hypothetical protein
MTSHRRQASLELPADKEAAVRRLIDALAARG